MREAMMSAVVGDDVYGEDPTVGALQDRVAAMLGFEAGLFCPSGTMCNQIAIRVQTRPQDEVICDHYSHVYLYEGGGIMAQSLASVQLLQGDRGRLQAAQVAAAIRPDDIHYPRTALVVLENTANKGGGSCYQLADIQAIRDVCDQHGIRLHLDGARLFNALLATGQPPAAYGPLFDTVSVCLSKGLGAPVGSVLCGSHDTIRQARRVRKMMGGGMRQAGFLAAAGLYALDHHLDRLTEDHQRARTLGQTLLGLDWVAEVLPVETNIVVFRPDTARVDAATLRARLAAAGVLVSAFGGEYLRMVTHLDIGDIHLDKAVAVLRRVGQG
jgi:threonine aldolase